MYHPASLAKPPPKIHAVIAQLGMLYDPPQAGKRTCVIATPHTAYFTGPHFYKWSAIILPADTLRPELQTWVRSESTASLNLIRQQFPLVMTYSTSRAPREPWRDPFHILSTLPMARNSIHATCQLLGSPDKCKAPATGVNPLTYSPKGSLPLPLFICANSGTRMA